jgi:hypothetical protein
MIPTDTDQWTAAFLIGVSVLVLLAYAHHLLIGRLRGNDDEARS